MEINNQISETWYYCEHCDFKSENMMTMFEHEERKHPKALKPKTEEK